MTRKRRIARLLVRLALPLAILAAVGSNPGSAGASRPQLGCTYGQYYEYFDENGNLCATSETCNNTGWGDCDDNMTYSSYDQYLHLCYCDP